MLLDGERADQPQAAVAVWEDADHARAPAELLVQALDQIGALHVLVMGFRKAVEGPGFLDVVLHPVGERCQCRSKIPHFLGFT